MSCSAPAGRRAQAHRHGVGDPEPSASPLATLADPEEALIGWQTHVSLQTLSRRGMLEMASAKRLGIKRRTLTRWAKNSGLGLRPRSTATMLATAARRWEVAPRRRSTTLAKRSLSQAVLGAAPKERHGGTAPGPGPSGTHPHGGLMEPPSCPESRDIFRHPGQPQRSLEKAQAASNLGYCHQDEPPASSSGPTRRRDAHCAEPGPRPMRRTRRLGQRSYFVHSTQFH